MSWLAVVTPWLTIIGVSEKAIPSLGAEALAHIKAAEVIIGAPRMLQSADLSHAACLNWTSPLCAMIDKIKAMRGQKVVVLATGDPMHFGVGASLARHLDEKEFSVLPSPSAFSLAANRLAWPLQSVACISLHGRAPERLITHLQPGNRILALTSNAATVQTIADLLAKNGFGESVMTVFEHMGSENEAHHRALAREMMDVKCAEFNTVAIDCVWDGETAFHAKTPGLADEAFEHNGKITKSEVRAITLAALKPTPGAILWDIGAGSGAISIEWMRSELNTRAIAFENDADQCARIRRNAKALGAPDLRLIEASAEEAIVDHPNPDAVFVGGGILVPGLVEKTMDALKTGGRLVANIVTLEGEQRAASLFSAHGGELTRIDISRLVPVGSMHGMKPRMAVTQWRWLKSK